MKKNLLGEWHCEVAATLNDQSQVLFALRDFEKAKPICFKVLEILKHHRGSKSSEVAVAMDNLSRCHARDKNFEESENLLSYIKYSLLYL